MKIKLTTYLNKVEAKYQNARDEWSGYQRELQEEEKRYNNIEWLYLTPEGKTAEHNKHELKRKEIFKKIDKMRADFLESVNSILEDSDKVFNPVYKYTPDRVDSNGITILQNGDLNYKEIIDLAETYRKSGNMTMYFLCAEKLKSDKALGTMDKSEREAYSYYTEARRRRETREDHELINNFAEVCLSGLRPEDYLSDGIHKEHEAFYQNFREKAEEIEAETSSPWDK